MDSGAFYFYLGGSGNDPAATYMPSGICLGRDNKIYIGELKVYDRTKRLREGFLYAADVQAGVVRPGPSMEKAPEDDMFYRTGWSTGITKMQDIGSDVREVYSLVLPHKTIGVSLDSNRRLLFAGSRVPGGVVSVVYDDGVSLTEIARLADEDLGGIHTVRYSKGFLYVVEDDVSFSEDGHEVDGAETKGAATTGRNRISRYRLTSGPEEFVRAVVKR